MPIPQYNQDMIAYHEGEILKLLGYDLKDPHFKDTPKRVAKFYSETLDGNYRDLTEFKERMTVFEDDSYQGIVQVSGVSFYAFCAHHKALFTGRAAIAYIPRNKRVLGLSKLVRILRHGCRHLTTQERIAAGAVKLLADISGSPDVACALIAEHTCMSCRGVQSHGAATITPAWGGRYGEDVNLQNQFLMMLDPKVK